MRLLEAIIEANQRAVAGGTKANLNAPDFSGSLPLVALTCIDPRLNRLVPEMLGVPEEQFIWLRNAGNIIFEPMSSMTRTLALACAVKGGKEIAIIGHSDCLVCKTTVMKLTDAFRALGVDRAKLPENLTEFFGLFASERQNVLRGAEIVRQSPLIGSKVPVHGLLMDIQTGRLEWLVNGYQTLSAADALDCGSVEAHRD
jgi:carbonic anhydrase